MPLFECEKCHCVENTAVSNFWTNQMDEKPQLCSECDPEIGKWHGKFPKSLASEHEGRAIEYPAKRRNADA